MTGNLITNASFLDGPTGWTAYGGTLDVHETGVGAPGRMVLASTHSAARWAVSTSMEVAAGQSIDALCLAASSAGAPTPYVFFYDESEASISGTPLARETSPFGPPIAGLAETMSRYRLRTAAPSGAAMMRLDVGLSVSGTLYVSKPLLALTPSPAPRHGLRWICGPHDNPDLDLPCWPSALPPLLQDGYSAQPIPDRSSWGGNAGIPANHAVNGGGWVQLKGTLSLTQVEREDLMAFYASFSGLNDAAFWFVRPDTEELVRARWAADGAPTDAKSAGRFKTSIGLLLEPA